MKMEHKYPDEDEIIDIDPASNYEEILEGDD